MAHRALTGVLLVGGASRRFGTPKALARLGAETLAERAWRVLGEACDERLAVGKGDELELPFPVLDDGADVRAPLAGIVAGLRAASHAVAVFLPVDVPAIRPQSLLALGDAVAAADPGPLPAAFAREHLPELERRLRDDELAVRDAVRALGLRRVALDPYELANVNEPRDLEGVARRERAVAAAVAATGDADACVLSDWNDTVVHLRDANLVARVATSTIAGDAHERLAREVAVAAYAHGRGGPVVAPAGGPLVHDGLVLTLWPYVDSLPREVTEAEVCDAVVALHASLDGYDGPLPALADELARAAARVDVVESADDRRLVARTLDLRADLQPARPIHGGAHAANLLVTDAGARWIDFDSACLGPPEWDYLAIPTPLLPPHDPHVLEVARRVASAAVVVWCLAQRGRAPEVDDAAEFHLHRLRERAAG